MLSLQPGVMCRVQLLNAHLARCVDAAVTDVWACMSAASDHIAG